MKEFLNALKCTIICQFVCWGVFLLCDENKYMLQSKAESLAVVSGIIILIILLVAYFVFSSKYIKNKNMDSKKFNIILFFLWLASSILVAFGLISLVNNNILHICNDSGWGCLLNGIEYGVEGFFMVVLALLILIIKIIIIIYKHIKKNKSSNSSVM